jgi:hypothetical protein
MERSSMPRSTSGAHQRSIACTPLRRWWRVCRVLAICGSPSVHLNRAVYVVVVAGATIVWVCAPPSDQETKPRVLLPFF